MGLGPAAHPGKSMRLSSTHQHTKMGMGTGRCACRAHVQSPRTPGVGLFVFKAVLMHVPVLPALDGWKQANRVHRSANLAEQRISRLSERLSNTKVKSRGDS